MHYHPEFSEYLQNEDLTQFRNISVSGIRDSCKNFEFKYERYTNKRDHKFWSNWYYLYYGDFMEEIKYKYSSSPDIAWKVGLLTMYYLTFIIGPIYGVSRFFNIVLPLIVILYLYINGGIMLFVDINPFQSMMWLIYVILMIIWWIMFYFVIRDEFILWWIMPHIKNFKAVGGNSRIPPNAMDVIIKEKYENIVVMRLIEKLLMEKYGDDIGKVILDLLVAIELPKIEDSYSLTEQYDSSFI